MVKCDNAVVEVSSNKNSVAIRALLNMYNAINSYFHDDEFKADAEFKTTLNQAYQYATKVEFDIDEGHQDLIARLIFLAT